jgi:hypothetical protein
LQKQFEDLLIEQCAPTLAGLKPGSLFRFSGASQTLTRQSVAQWDAALRPYGVRITILKECARSDASMVYVYRTAWLKEILSDRPVAQFLSRFGYPTADLPELLRVLSRRYCTAQGMPHEIGVFLGYPLADVIGFIEHKGRDFTCCGCWKCYGDAAAAQQCFDRYRACTSKYQALYQSGTPIIQLIVAA